MSKPPWHNALQIEKMLRIARNSKENRCRLCLIPRQDDRRRAVFPLLAFGGLVPGALPFPVQRIVAGGSKFEGKRVSSL